MAVAERQVAHPRPTAIHMKVSVDQRYDLVLYSTCLGATRLGPRPLDLVSDVLPFIDDSDLDLKGDGSTLRSSVYP